MIEFFGAHDQLHSKNKPATGLSSLPCVVTTIGTYQKFNIPFHYLQFSTVEEEPTWKSWEKARDVRRSLLLSVLLTKWREG